MLLINYQEELFFFIFYVSGFVLLQNFSIFMHFMAFFYLIFYIFLYLFFKNNYFPLSNRLKAV